MRKFTFTLCSIMLSLGLMGQEKPKLVVGIVVDQMKQEYLWRFDNHFGNGGFNRLVDSGFVAKNGHFNYSATSTGPGHASVYTGTTPSIHGIVDNVWYSRALKKTVYCAEDSTAVAVGGAGSNGQISPVNLYSSTITDELKMATQHRGKVIAMSLKDRGSALPGGHLSDGSYWYDPKSGRFMTSSYYMDDLPKWVNEFNDRGLADKYSNRVWSTKKSLRKYKESGKDNSPYERSFSGMDTPTFPYNLSELRKYNGNFALLASTPFGNTILVDLALAAIEEEELGADEITDFLAISFSSPDYIGHRFGPQSKEVQDNYVRLDDEIERLLDYLDSEIGKGEYVVVLTADHGVAENSQRMKDDKFRADNINSRDLFAFIDSALVHKYGASGWFEGPRGYDSFLNHDLIQERNIDLYEIQTFIAQTAMKFTGVYMALTSTDMVRNSYTDQMRKLMQNSFHPKESGDIKMILDPAWQRGGSQGTGHGNAWIYDTHIPIILYGWGIKPGSSVRRIHISDIAPSLSMLLEIRMPSGATGQPIYEAFR